MFERKKLMKYVKILAVLILLELIGIVVIKCMNYDIPKSNDNEKPKNEEVKIPNTFKGKIINNTKTELDEDILSLLTDYMDSYFKSMYTLKTYDTSIYFDNYEEGLISYNAIDLLVESRKLYDLDFTLSKAKYNLSIKKIDIKDNIYNITFYEDDELNFNFINDTTSYSYNIENNITIKKVNDKYKIIKYRKVQDYYVMFTNIYSFKQTDNNEIKNELDSIEETYLKEIKNELSNNKELLENYNDKKLYSEKECKYPYDRTKAVDYSNKYYHERNEEWVDYSIYGGNCQNYASQSIYNGGIPMDSTGNIDNQWKHYSSVINPYEAKSGRSSSWTGVGNFYTYVKGNTGIGLCGEVDLNIFYTEPGDVIQVGYNGIYRHTTFVNKVIKDNANMPIILVNSNSVDLHNYPIIGYLYPMKRLIKINGYN